MTGCRPLTEDEIKAVTQSFRRQRDRTLFILGYRSGFRISELLSLKVSDVFQYGKVVARVTVARKNMKGNKSSRAVVLHAEAAAELLKLIQDDALGGSDYLFRSQKGPKNSPLTRIQAWRVLKLAFAANQIEGKTGTHSMRKSFAARVYEKLDHDLIRTQRALGHRNINSTVSYLSFSETEIDEAVLTA